MELVERLIFFMLGGGVGFIFGFVAAHLRVIEKKVDAVKKEVHEVDLIVKGEKKREDERDRNDEGAFRIPSATNVMLVVVLAITLFAAFSSAQNNNNLDRTVYCLTKYNESQGQALSTRDEAIHIAARAEIQLWGLYNRLYNEGSLPNTSEERVQELQDTLAKAISDYRLTLIESQSVREAYEYEEPNFLSNCEKRDDR